MEKSNYLNFGNNSRCKEEMAVPSFLTLNTTQSTQKKFNETQNNTLYTSVPPNTYE